MLKILIVNYNTQELTDCTIKSVNKHTPDCHIYVFDNSDEKPFVNTFDNVTIIDNTRQQIINFEEFLSRYPNKARSHGYMKGKAPSPKHCYTIDKCFDIIDDNFILLDSDVIVKRDLHELVDESCIFVGDVALQPLTKDVKRVLPFVCYINVNMCKKYGVRYFDENYMHGICCNKKNPYADRYDTGGGFYHHASKYKHKDIDYRGYAIHYKGGSWDDKATRTAGKYKSPEEFMNKYRTLWATDYKKVVYTCISGKYDTLREPKVIEPGYDYICFTDQFFNSDVWNFKPIPKELENLSQVKRQRNIKVMPHLYLPEYDFSVWVDSNVEIRGSIEKYCKENNVKPENGYLYVGKHPRRDCLYTEAQECILQKKDTKENINPQMERYRKEGMPEHFGLPQSCILLRYHNNEKAKAFGEAWFKEINQGSHRDQLSFSYVNWKLGDGVVYLPSTIFSCECFKWWVVHTATKVPILKATITKNEQPVKPIITDNKVDNRISDKVKQILAAKKARYNQIME